MNLSASIHIARSPSEVFDYVCDIRHDVAWRTGVVEAAVSSGGPMGVGSSGFDRAEANDRSMVSEWTVYEFEPGSHARWNLTSGPFMGRGGYVCDPDDGGTRFTLESDVRPTGWFRLLGPLFGLMGRRQNRADVAKLKQILEGG